MKIPGFTAKIEHVVVGENGVTKTIVFENKELNEKMDLIYKLQNDPNIDDKKKKQIEVLKNEAQGLMSKSYYIDDTDQEE